MKVDLGASNVFYPMPAFIVGSYNEDGSPNAMNVAWGGACSGEPPCIQLSIRPGRKTLDNIKRDKVFTVNIPSARNMVEADYFGIDSGHRVDKVAKTGMITTVSQRVKAPIFIDFPLVAECKLVKLVEIGSHVMVIGEILNILADEEILFADGKVDISKLEPLAYDPGTKTYCKITETIGKAFSVGLKYRGE